MIYRDDPQTAFDQAISQRRLSIDPKAPLFAGHYMYIGTTDRGLDLFKHQDTRKYLDDDVARQLA